MVRSGPRFRRQWYLLWSSQERARAAAMGYESPVQETIEATHESFGATLALLLQAVRHEGASVLVATHNEESVRLATTLMDHLELDPRTAGVYFGQLLGMSDFVTFTLGRDSRGYQAYKYVPFGPVQEASGEAGGKRGALHALNRRGGLGTSLPLARKRSSAQRPSGGWGCASTRRISPTVGY